MLQKSAAHKKSLLRRIFSPLTFSIIGSLTLIVVGVFSYFYLEYSKMIDARFRGDILIRTTGIYAAPRTIRTGQAWTLAAIKSYLDNLGYVESSKEADSKRGRYQIKNQALEIHTGSDAVIDGVRQFPNLSIAFAANGKGIAKLTDLDSKRNLDSAQLEPELMTAMSNDKQRQKQKIVSFQDLPKDYINAVVAIEDRQFFNHVGINFRGIMRALRRNVEENEIQQGGSSITQQLVKNFFLTPERTWGRKLQEMMIAVTLETKLSKNEIFQLYANEVYMGQSGSYSINGVGEAAETYFNKDVVNLTLPECAFLAGIIRGPSLYSPYSHKERSKTRRNTVLDAMVEAGHITRDVADKAKATNLDVQPKRSAMNSDAPYFTDYLQQQLADDLAGHDLSRESFRVYSTIDLDLQRAADKALSDGVAVLDPIFSKRRKNPVPSGTLQAALIALNAKTGEILAMTGGRDYSRSQLNRAVEAKRQPGSVFKPIVYAAALNSAFEDADEEVITPASRFMDEKKTFYYGRGETYEPGNFGDTFSNKEVTLRDALTRSLNVVTVQIAERVGYNKVARMAEKLGLPRPQALPSTALGAAEATPLQIASAYTAFANGGKLSQASPLQRVTDSDGASVSTVSAESRSALRPEIAWLMTNVMQDVMNKGTAARSRAMGFTATAAGKTGTSRDGWFAGYTSNIVCVVWVGFDDNAELGLEGSKSALPIWVNFMKQALALRPDLAGSAFQKPDGIVSVEVDPTTGWLASSLCTVKRTEYFVQGTEPDESCITESGEHPQPNAKLHKEPGEVEDATPIDPPKKIPIDVEPPAPDEKSPEHKPTNANKRPENH